MRRIGAHVSISDGFASAVKEQADLGGNCGQVFVGSPRGWAVGDVDEDAAAEFVEARAELDIDPWIVHGTYLINFATPKDDLADKSVTCVQDELDAAAALDIPYYVFHPGAHTGAGTETGIANVADRLNQLSIPSSVTLLLENTAGKGTTVGKRLDELNTMIEESDYGTEDIGVCLDTCHLFAAGYDFSTADAMDALIAEIDETVGLERVNYLHLNDSKHEFDSAKDEHHHIGKGEIGEEAFAHFVNHEAFREKPIVLETPVDDIGYAWNIDKVNELLTGH